MPSWKNRARHSSSRSQSFAETIRSFARGALSGGQARAYWGLVIFLSIVFLMGGASRSDVQSLILLRPLAVITCGFALLSLRWEHLRDNRSLVWMAVLIFVLVGIHLIPLPPAIWKSLPGRDLIAEIDAAAGIANQWRPLTMTPGNGANAFFSLFVPLAVLLLACQLDGQFLRRLILPILIIGALSGIIGVFQTAGDPHGPLYLYRITNNGAAVGLFSNRNHQAVFLATLFPILALFASQSLKTEYAIKLRLAIAIGGAVMLVPLVLVTGSRLGLILGIFGLAAALFVYRRPEATGVRRRTERKNLVPIMVGGIAIVVLGLVTVMASRAEALKRLVGTNVGEEERTQAWSLVSRMAQDYLPWGSGSGSFVELYRHLEPMSGLTPVYFNHAHNDWLEIWMTFGVPGIALILIAAAIYVMGVRRIMFWGERRDFDVLMAQAGACIIFLFAVASIVDYPLRTPSLACLFVIACCWMYSGIRIGSITAGNARRD